VEATRRLAALTGTGAAVDAFARTMKLDLAAAAGTSRAAGPSATPALAELRAVPRPRDRWILVAGVTIAALVALAIAAG
jgi:hypothetical protein